MQKAIAGSLPYAGQHLVRVCAPPFEKKLYFAE